MEVILEMTTTTRRDKAQIDKGEMKTVNKD